MCFANIFGSFREENMIPQFCHFWSTKTCALSPKKFELSKIYTDFEIITLIRYVDGSINIKS